MNNSVFTKERAFYAIMAGQMVSTIGSSMTRFGLGIWVLQETGNTAVYSILLFFAVLPLGLGSLFAGPLVDRWDRRTVLIVGNIVASFSTLVVALLFFADVLEFWHLYVALAVNGVANAFIFPALDASVPLLVAKEQLGRASGLTQMIQAFEIILGPALAGLVLGGLGLGAIFVVDFVTFGASIVALLLVAIPRPTANQDEAGQQTLWQSFTFGVTYIRERPAFLYLMGFVTLTMLLMPGFGYALVTPLVLSFADEQAAGFVLSSFGIGAMVGGILLTAWGGPKRRMDGILGAMVLAAIAAVLAGLRESVWITAAGMILIGVSFVFMIGLNRVIWQVKAAPTVLGRVFSLRVALGVGAQSIGVLLAGILAERWFEPWLNPDGALASSVGQLTGTGAGRGMAFMFMLIGILLLILTVVSFILPQVRRMEDQIPDYVEPASVATD
ncbi:MAG: MFS transporter [Chloroflexota bacterium]